MQQLAPHKPHSVHMHLPPGLMMTSAALTCRFGSLADLMLLCLRHQQLATLRRVLAQAGARGSAALHQVCTLLSPESSPLTANPPDQLQGSIDELSLDERWQHLYRCQLVLGMRREAGMQLLLNCIILLGTQLYCHRSTRLAAGPRL